MNSSPAAEVDSSWVESLSEVKTTMLFGILLVIAEPNGFSFIANILLQMSELDIYLLRSIREYPLSVARFVGLPVD